MAVLNNAGTTPIGSEPQSAGTDGQGQGQGAGGGGDAPSQPPKRKIAGKFETLEEAVEQGYVGLERGFHEVTTTVNRLTKLIETAMTPPAGDDPAYRAAPVGRGGPAHVDPYGRGQQEDEIDPKDFIMNPGAVLKQREERLLNLVGRVVSSAVSQAQIVNDFKAQNPDLLKHERLVQGFMSQLDQRLPLAERLAEAAKSTRAYLAQMKAEFTGQPARVPSGSEYVEPARGGEGQGGQPPIGTAPVVDEGEKDLVDYINERNQLYSSHFGSPSK